MIFQSREYQNEIDALTLRDWAHGARDVMVVAPCGAGKTVMFSRRVREARGASVVIVHRNHLVGQASVTLARNGIRHRVIGSAATQRICTALHMNAPDIGRNFVDPTAPAAVAGVDTLIGMDPKHPWFGQVTDVITDEGHHLLAANKWGKARAMFPNARGAAYTATAMRPDGKGLGRHADGVIDSLVEVIGMRDLIRMGYLADYEIYAPPNTLDLSDVTIGPSGEMNQDKAGKAVKRANITGDIVNTYCTRAMGRLGATFAVNIEEAVKLTAAYREAGVPAELITGDTPDTLRDSIFKRYKRREVLQLVSVDVLGEGTDVPAMEVVSLGRPTASWVTYVQQFCRPLRVHEGKDAATIFDHVGNVERHARTRGLPDTPQKYHLNRRDRAPANKPSDATPMQTCTALVDEGKPTERICAASYEKALDRCPACDAEHPAPAGRSTPQQVDGVLALMDPALLAALRGEVDRIDGPFYAPAGLTGIPARGAANQHHARQQAQARLRAAMALWGGWQDALGRSQSEAQRRWFFRYGMDPLTAAALGAREAQALEVLVREELSAAGVVEA